ncbi:aminotransferase class I/II-fold pyridoxal phosphate-dependent enzyme [Cellulomonas marina]|uniref:aminotransferase class I/II-fold pyridoxal phosphate-dependent enzyme n=1 Tax=Cellulomonas marina TaxID=988821 RepID=UPI001A378085|nr:aminotransferase class I/II-fold pyridoxal phosphate-dependent enzyme [Cellulomonas marina]GIG28057.1 GntR family transcriptional regulator [Cellulomonas marina]
MSTTASPPAPSGVTTVIQGDVGSDVGGDVGGGGVVDLVRHVEDRSPRGIAAAVARCVRAGDLAVGDRLPTVRELARALGVSPATVSGAFRALSAVGLVASRGRAGTFVLAEPAGWLPPRYRRMAAGAPARLDLSRGTPDPALLPALGPAVARAAAAARLDEAGSYLDAPLVPRLEALLRASWPFAPDRLTVVDGAMDAIGRTLEVVARYGARVAVEEPGFPPLFDLLDQLGLERVPMTLDRSGVRPDALAAALAAGAAAVVLQPRAHNPTGVSLTTTRARELAAVVRLHAARAASDEGVRQRRVVVVEDDHSGQIASSRDVSLGAHLPAQVVHVRSYSKSHGPDLRLAAVGGPAAVLDALVGRRMLGPGWTSRLLQHTLVDLLTDADALDAVADARRVYFARQRALVDALAAHGLVVTPGDGINLWVPVRDEAAALVHLEAAGVRVSPGAPYRAGPGAGEPHVRVTVGALREGTAEVAAALALAARA